MNITHNEVRASLAWFKGWLEHELSSLPSHIDDNGALVMAEFKPLYLLDDGPTESSLGTICLIIDSDEFVLPNAGREADYFGPTINDVRVSCLVVETAKHSVPVLVAHKDLANYAVGDILDLADCPESGCLLSL